MGDRLRICIEHALQCLESRVFGGIGEVRMHRAPRSGSGDRRRRESGHEARTVQSLASLRRAASQRRRGTWPGAPAGRMEATSMQSGWTQDLKARPSFSGQVRGLWAKRARGLSIGRSGRNPIRSCIRGLVGLQMGRFLPLCRHALPARNLSSVPLHLHSPPDHRRSMAATRSEAAQVGRSEQLRRSALHVHPVRSFLPRLSSPIANPAVLSRQAIRNQPVACQAHVGPAAYPPAAYTGPAGRPARRCMDLPVAETATDATPQDALRSHCHACEVVLGNP